MMTLKQKIKQIKYIKNTPVLETERLILRPITPKDAEQAFVWLSDEKVNKFMPYNLYRNTDEVLHWINTIIPKDKNCHWGIVVKENNLLIGSCSIGPDKKRTGCLGLRLQYPF